MQLNYASFSGMIKRDQTFCFNFSQMNLNMVIEMCGLYALCTKNYVCIVLLKEKRE